jgi:hypothetical protein
MIKVRCPHCDQKLGMPDNYTGHRVRCSKCGQPFVVPAVQNSATTSAATVKTPSANARPQSISQSANAASAVQAAGKSAGLHFKTPQAEPSEPLDDFDEVDQAPDLQVEEDPREQAIRLARQQRAKEAHAGSKSNQRSAATPATDARTDKPQREPLADRVPEAMRLPLGLALAVIFMSLVIVGWIFAAKTASNALCFVALFVPMASAFGLKLVTVNRTIFLGFLGTLIGGLEIAAGKAAIAQYVVIPFQREYVKQEVLTDMPKLLADERFQIDSGESVRFVTRDGDFMTCIALFALVDEGKADPIEARRWAFDILRASNKTNVYAHLASILGSAPDVPKRPEIQEQDQPMFDMAWAKMGEWEETETDFQNARKYFPALNCIGSQCETDRLLSKPETAFQFALLDTLGLFDALWILLGMGLAYISLSMD